ncbi:AraC family transcriptional regulator [Massilia sp. B-10]|nr:AraC family transcriptional regulator [Massilia sp. B-10]
MARLEAARAGLAASVARWAGPDQEPFTGPIPALEAVPAHRAVRADELHVRPQRDADRARPQARAAGRRHLLYDAGELLITSVDLPAIGEIIEADPERPFLSLSMRLDQRVMTELIVEGNLHPPRAEPTGRGMTVGQASLPLLQAFQRLIDLFDTPDAIPVLSPLIQREILYRLMVSEQGTRLWQIASLGSQGQRIARAIAWLKEHATEPLRVDELAASVQMSTSTFHHHFRALTAMSPLQFQKWLRLHDARLLMLTEHLDAATAAFRVGYESPSQFGREYHRLFGAPPARHCQLAAGARRGAYPVGRRTTAAASAAASVPNRADIVRIRREIVDSRVRRVRNRMPIGR